jgi:hypothetical protein
MRWDDYWDLFFQGEFVDEFGEISQRSAFEFMGWLLEMAGLQASRFERY